MMRTAYTPPAVTALLAMTLLAGCNAPKVAPEKTAQIGWLRDVTAQTDVASYTFEMPKDRPLTLLQTIGNGCALADFNNDGWLDMLVTNRWEAPQIWRNGGTGLDARWIAVDLQQAGANRNAIGAVVELRTDPPQRREVTVGGGHAGGQLGTLHFGIGAAEAADVRVIWPDGAVGAWAEVRAGETAVLAN